MKRLPYRTIAFLPLLFLLASCGAQTAKRTMPAFPYRPAAAGWDEPALERAVGRFYAARDVKEAEKAVEQAVTAAPDAPATHEIAGRLALVAGNEDEAWRHFYLALAQPDNPLCYQHLLLLLRVQDRTSQFQEARALFSEILASHPDQGMRRVAAAFLANWHRRLDADVPAAEAALAQRGSLTRFALISPFDNDDGKGFTVEYPPEREIEFDEEYPGNQFPARWRMDVPVDHQHSLDLRALVSPGNSVAAYAVTHVKMPQDGAYRLRITTTDPIRMWVNNIEVLSQETVTADTVDQFVVPVQLRAGWNRILIKSCNDRGDWRVGAALTDPAGALVPGIEVTAEKRDVAAGPPPGPGYSFIEDVRGRLDGVEDPVRGLLMALELADSFGLPVEAENLADRLRAAAPRSMIALYNWALVKYGSGQPGSTIDVLEHLIESNGGGAPLFLVQRAMFFSGQDRADRARQDLLAAVEANPDCRTARLRLSGNYASEGWNEEALAARLADAGRWPDDTGMLWALSSSYRALGRNREAEAVYARIGELWRGAEDIIDRLVEVALSQNDYGRAVRLKRQACGIYPNSPGCFLALARILRRAGRLDEAAEAYRRALALDDRWSTPFTELGDMAREAGAVGEAVSLWKQGLEYAPDNHSLADRIDFVAPTDAGLLGEYVPTADEIRGILAGRDRVTIHPGANVVYLLDHAVEQIEPDGSGRQVVTQIIRSVNDTGRDQMGVYQLPWGRLKVFEAFAIDPDGTRREASSLRDAQVRFRELKVGSTIVLQYRSDSRPTGYLSRWIFRRWFFHGLGGQFEISRFVMILPKQARLGEWGRGRYRRTEQERKDRLVVTWEGQSVPPLVGEPSSPPLLDLLDQVAIGTVPGWETIAGWDAALMVDAFRVSPEIEGLTARIIAGARTPRERLDALARFVMREIRYQQDYETSIAGVKPHTASVVLQRGYGDCKDKSVLLMTLARQAGIETRFAILRTTGVGDLIRDVPFMQFNHAIVYVPVQAGIPEPLFVDATPDTLDLATLRPDIQGALALVIDPATRKWEFIGIPMRPAEEHFTLRRSRIEPALEGPSRIRVDLSFQGPTAAALRQVLRNADETQILAAQIAAQLFSGAKVTRIDFAGHDDIVRPLEVTLELESDQLLRRQGDDIVIDLPKSETLSEYVSLAERKLPLQSGLFRSLIESADTVAIPEGYAISHQAPDLIVDNEFFRFERVTARAEGSSALTVRLNFTEKVHRVEPKDYPRFRDEIQKVVTNLKQDLILSPVTSKRKPAKGAR
jgi:tetratricopeptide (TPR) repeat protein